MNDAIERQIEQLLGNGDLGAPAFSLALFGPNGLFNRLASSEQERRIIARSDLFQRANARLTQLQCDEAGALSKAAQERRAANAQTQGDGKNGVTPGLHSRHA
jgi:hypothetical protein